MAGAPRRPVRAYRYALLPLAKITLRNHDASWAKPGRRAKSLSPTDSPRILSKHLAFLEEFSKMRPMPPVIRASGGRCDVTRCAPRAARDAARYP